MKTDQQIIDEVDYIIAMGYKKPSDREIEIRRLINLEAQFYLQSTDWYIIRQLETGVPVPPEITAQRALARTRVL